MSDSEDLPTPNNTPMDDGTVDAQAANAEAELEADVANIDKVRFPPPTQATIDRCRAATVADVKALDEQIVEKGMHMFFDNKFKEAEELFAAHYQEDPLIANAFGTLGSIRALLSFDGQDIEEASNRLLYSNNFASKVAPQGQGIRGALRAMGSWFGRGKQKNLMTTTEFRALVCMGEAELLRANVILLKDTMSGYLKAGLALRRGYNIYDRLQKYVAEYPDEHGADEHSLGGMHFGLGAIHVTTSILPPKILAFLKALGYMHDREVGFHHLQQCLNSKSLRAPIASLYMLCFDGMLPSFAPLMVASSVPKAEAVIEQTLSMFPKSVIHLWLAGRVSRLKREIPEAIATFQQCVDYGSNMKDELPQLKHFAEYDLAFTLCSQLKWEEAEACFNALENGSNWSRMFYAYAQGCCCEQRGDIAKAKECFQRAAEYPSIKIAGKVISVEQFVKRRLPTIVDNGYSTLHLPFMKARGLDITGRTFTSGIELMMHFNVFSQMVDEDLAKTRAIVETALAQHQEYTAELFRVDAPEYREEMAKGKGIDIDTLGDLTAQLHARLQASVEQCAILALADANLLRGCGRFDEAAAIYTSIHEDRFLPADIQGAVKNPTPASPSKKKKGAASGLIEINEETWVKPYALYEHAVLHYKHADALAATKGAEDPEVLNHRVQGVACFDNVNKLYKGKDYSFEMQMSFRLHLTNDVLRGQNH